MYAASLSFIIPAFNASPYLKRCLDSIRQYAKDNIETIVVDDGSTDNTLSFLSHYQRMYPKFWLRILHQKNQGVSSARNSGLLHESGRLVSFIDADDQLDANWYRKVAPFFNTYFDIISFRLVTTLANTSVIDQTIHSGKISNETLHKLYCTSGALNSACAKLITIKCIEHAHALFKPGLSMGEDALFMGQLIEDNVSFFQSNDVLYRYISNPTSSTHTSTCLDYDPSLILKKYNLSAKLPPSTQIKSHIFLFNSFVSSIRTAIRHGNISWRALQEHIPHYWQSTHMEDICQGLEKHLDLRRKIELHLLTHKDYRLLKFELGTENFARKLIGKN